MRSVFYALVIIGLVGGGWLDFCKGNYKLAVLATLFAAANAVVFYWK